MQAPRQGSAVAPQDERAQSRRTWETPRLKVHGTVAAITAGGGGTLPDTGGGNSSLTPVE
jgi:hypothetical protein